MILFGIAVFLSVSGCDQEETPDFALSLDYNIKGSSSNELQHYGDVVSCTIVEKNAGNTNLVNKNSPYVQIGLDQPSSWDNDYFYLDDHDDEILMPGESWTYTFNHTFTEDDIPICDVANRTLKIYTNIETEVVDETNGTRIDLGDKNTTIIIPINKSVNLTERPNPFLELKDYLPSYPDGAVVNIHNGLAFDIFVDWVMNGSSNHAFSVVIPAQESRTVSAPAGDFEEYITFNYTKNGHFIDVPLGTRSYTNPLKWPGDQLESGNEYKISYYIETENWNGVPQPSNYL
ncbi:MAG: hypothetical protein LLG05_14405 [Porphyromonadaceae bacterium]|nr:hypothetical protein [Porphyromonadaceae bacterium]